MKAFIVGGHMADQEYQRKLTAILSADVAGYSMLMRDDEAETVRTITTYRKALAQLIQQYRGRMVDSPGGWPFMHKSCDKID
jgi:adenylate cyclase